MALKQFPVVHLRPYAPSSNFCHQLALTVPFVRGIQISSQTISGFIPKHLTLYSSLP